MSCKKYSISNTGTTLVTFNYQRCDTTEWEYQNQLLPGQSKNIWAVNDTLSIPNFFDNEIELDSENFFRGAGACTTCDVIDTPCNGEVVVSNGISITGITSNAGCFGNTFTYNYPCQGNVPITIKPGPGTGTLVNSGSSTITFLFSQPISSLMFNSGVWNGQAFPSGDRVNIYTNVGGIPTITQCAGCPMFISNGSITAVNTDGMARFLVETPTPFSSITFTQQADAVYQGVRISLCKLNETSSTTPTPTPSVTSTSDSPTSTPTVTPTQTLDCCDCFSLTNDGDPTNTNSTTYIDCYGETQTILNKVFESSATYFCALPGTITTSAGLTVIEVPDDGGSCGGACNVCPTQTPTVSPSCTKTPTCTPTITCTPSVTKSCTPSVTETPSNTPTESNTPTPTETEMLTPTPTESAVVPTNTPTVTQTPTCQFGDCYHYVEFTISAATEIAWNYCGAPSSSVTYSAETYPANFTEGPTIEADCFSGNSYTILSGLSLVSINYFNPCCDELVTPTPTSSEASTPTPTPTTSSVLETPTPTPTETSILETPTPTNTETSGVTTPTPTPSITPTCNSDLFGNCYQYLTVTFTAQTNITGTVCTDTGQEPLAPSYFELSAATYPSTTTIDLLGEGWCLLKDSWYDALSGSAITSFVYSGACCTETTPTPTPTETSVLETPTQTETSVLETPTPTETSVLETPTCTPTLSETPTNTPTETETPTPEVTPTCTPSFTPSSSPTPSVTPLDFCTCYSLTNDGDPSNINTTDYLDCNHQPQSIVNKIQFTTADYFCAISGSVTTSAGLTVTEVNESFCGGCIEGLTPTPTETPTNTPTPSVTPSPVTGYSFNLIQLPYFLPATGNTIMNDTAPIQTGTTNPNELTLNSRGIYWSSRDSDGIDRTSYFSQFTGQSVTFTISQTGSTAVYSGDTSAFKFWSGNTESVSGPLGTGFVFGTNIGISTPNQPASGTAILISSASTIWTSGVTVYISATINS